MKEPEHKILFLLLLLLPACFLSAENRELEKVNLMVQWLPQAQFAGYYAAKDAGIYKKYGLDVTIKSADPQRSASDFLEKGEVDFITLFLSTGIKLRSNGMKIVNIGQTSQGSALVFVAKKSSGISQPGDMNGKKLGLWISDFRDMPEAFLKQYKINAQLVPIASGINLFLRDGIDVITVMHYNEYHTILNSGINEDELTAFHFSDHNLDIPEDGIYCMEAFYRKKPELCRRFVMASMEGWRYAMEHETETLLMISKRMKEVHLPYNESHQKWMLKKISGGIFGKNTSRPGTLSEAQYEKCARVMLNDGVIKTIPVYNDFYIKQNGAANDPEQ